MTLFNLMYISVPIFRADFVATNNEPIEHTDINKNALPFRRENVG